MGRKTIQTSASDIAEYSQCTLCNVVFKTENVSKSKLIQVYKAHCHTKGHLSALAGSDKDNTKDNDLREIVAKQQKQIDLLINAVKQLSQENMQLREQSIRTEHHYKQFRQDLFGRANKYGTEHENMLGYKSFNERLTALEEGRIPPPKTPKKDIEEAIQEEPEAQKPKEVIYITEDNIEEYNPYVAKQKTEFSNKFELNEETLDKINCIPEIMSDKDDDGVDTLEDIQYEIENFDLWIEYMRKNSQVVLNAGKINEIKNNIQTITLILEKIINNFKNPKYNMENRAIQEIYQLLKVIAQKEWTINDLI